MTDTETVTDPTDVSDLGGFVVDEHSRYYDFYRDDRDLSEWHVALDLTDEEREAGRYDPMMNYLWPLPEESDTEYGWTLPDDATDRLDNMTVVEVDAGDEWGLYLALTGGGMDMSLSIARSYVALGLLPPASLGRLPGGVGVFNPDSPEDRRALAALRKAHSMMIARHRGDMDELDRLTDE